ncbi:MAG: hypothetical protein ABF311_10530 [Polaribacter sp.]|jgi:hypothetical protein
MKNIKSAVLLFLLTITVFVSCEDNTTEAPLTIQNKIEILETNQWLLKGFEESVMHTFSNGERFTYYAVNNEFTEDAIPGTEDYIISGDLLTMDFHFGNVKTYELVFSCNNTIVEFYSAGILQSTLYQRNSNYQSCL